MKREYKYVKCEELYKYGEWDIVATIPSHYYGKEDMAVISKLDYSDCVNKFVAQVVEMDSHEGKEN